MIARLPKYDLILYQYLFHDSLRHLYYYRCFYYFADGNGYPDNLKGNEIPYGAQIIAIADTFDALTSNRIYRKSICSDLAFEVLIKEKGKQFNPELVDIFIDVIKNKFLSEQPLNKHNTLLKVL
ncbi:HD-GYP domain-containing protein [Clostridium sp. DJ247]|uniref:HD-GYP domain-containing protein n=1 Tax=Clostridium sp. DJ247 TaxID=2726188 RepID=UPI001628819E|nr:HD domain-containing phosphohydrolase [Clostridium sp. DJ247]MBC2582400.1 hypothetical protein [Clostridium sp. DJ247]